MGGSQPIRARERRQLRLPDATETLLAARSRGFVAQAGAPGRGERRRRLRPGVHEFFAPETFPKHRAAYTSGAAGVCAQGPTRPSPPCSRTEARRVTEVFMKKVE